MRFRLSPDSHIALGVSVKDAGERLRGCETEMEVDDCGTVTLLPYEELLEDAMEGNQTWFAREDYVEESWRIIDPVLANRPKPYVYEAGSWGPPEGDKLVEVPGGWWRAAAGSSRMTLAFRNRCNEKRPAPERAVFSPLWIEPV